MNGSLDWASSAEVRRIASREARWSARRLGPAVDAADVEQEVAIALLRGAANYDRERGSLSAWARAVARSRARQLVARRHASKRTFIADECDVDDCTAANAAPLDLLVDVQRALDELPDRLRRTCVELMHHSVAETARRLRLSRTTVYAHMAKVRRCFAARGLGEYVGMDGAA